MEKARYICGVDYGSPDGDCTVYALVKGGKIILINPSRWQLLRWRFANSRFYRLSAKYKRSVFRQPL